MDDSGSNNGEAGMFSAGNSRLSSHLSHKKIEEVNKFIKKLNFEKYHIVYGPKIPGIFELTKEIEWQKELMLK